MHIVRRRSPAHPPSPGGFRKAYYTECRYTSVRASPPGTSLSCIGAGMAAVGEYVADPPVLGNARGVKLG
jgi:hypothetical protein